MPTKEQSGVGKYGLFRVGQSVVTNSPGAARSTQRAFGIEKLEGDPSTAVAATVSTCGSHAGDCSAPAGVQRVKFPPKQFPAAATTSAPRESA